MADSFSIPFDALIDRAYQRMEELGYRPDTLQHYRGTWRRLKRFAEERGECSFSPEVGLAFLESLAIPLHGEPQAASTSWPRHQRTAVRILEEFAVHGAWKRRRSVTDKVPFPESLRSLPELMLEHWRTRRDVAPRTLYVMRKRLLEWSNFLSDQGLRRWEDLTPRLITAFFASVVHLSPRTLADYRSFLRQFLRFSWREGHLPCDLSDHVPSIHLPREPALPSTWEEAEVRAVLAAIDRGSPIGRRDYAILLLVTHLGLRAGEIRQMRLDDFEWEAAVVHVWQPKTQQRVTLPLFPEVGQAVIDYLQSGRPPTSHREVFVRHKAPFAPFAANDNLHHIVTKYRRLAGLRSQPSTKVGIHSLRHTLATRLLTQGTPLETIAAVLGHASVNTTRIYTRVDLDALRCAALDPERIGHE